MYSFDTYCIHKLIVQGAAEKPDGFQNEITQ
jgi:hypothetical protein